MGAIPGAEPPAAKIGMAGSGDIAGPWIEFAAETGPLHPLVQSYYLYRSEAPEIRGVERVDIGQIRFMLRGAGAITFSDGSVGASCPVMVNGPGVAAFRYRVEGPFHCFGVSLRAIGWKSLIGVPAHTVANRILDGEQLFGREAGGLLERLRKLDTLDEMIAAVQPFLLARRRPVPRSHLALAHAVREWAAAEEPAIETLFAMVKMGPRQVTRLCNEYYGGPPKHLQRKFRAIRAAMRIYQGASNADAAGPFSDQPHMIKEIKHFTGHTPSTLRAGIDPVLAVTLDNETFQFLPDVFPESVDPGG